MEKVKVFSGTPQQCEEKVNEWFKEQTGYFTIHDQLQSAIPTEDGGVALVISVFYTGR